MSTNNEDAQEEVHNDDLYQVQTITVDKGQTQLRLDKFLMSRIERATRNKVQNAIKSGSIKVNDKEVKPNYRVRPLDEIRLIVPKSNHDGFVEPQDIPLDIRYEDDHLLVVHKPPGMVVHPGFGNPDKTLVNALAFHFKDLPVKEGNLNDRPGLVHRIDKDTSGLLVIAKTEYVISHLAKQFADHTVDRSYVALVWGEPDPEAGTVDMHVGRDLRNRLVMSVFPDGDHGKHAITHYETIEPLGYVCLVRCKLETGRTHQIRAHMKSLGHPLFNDARYGGASIVKGTVFTRYKQFVHNAFKMCPRQALHAQTLGFEHPITGERIHIEADLPEDMASVIDKWRKYTATRRD